MPRQMVITEIRISGIMNAPAPNAGLNITYSGGTTAKR